MSADVGGRLETVAPRRSLFVPDYCRIAALLAVAVAIHFWLVTHTAVSARDSIAFARLMRNISDPNAGNDFGTPRQRIDVIRSAEQPPGYPLSVWSVDKSLKSFTSLPVPDRSLLATQITNAIAAILLVVPMYLMGRILFGRNVGFAAALLFQVLPVPARLTSDGLSEGVYLLVVTSAILLGVRASRRPGIGSFLLCGMATGASYLIRPEGLLVAAGVGSVILLAWVMRRWTRADSLGRLTALSVGVGLVGAPYMVLIGKLTAKPTGDYITNPFDQQPANIWRGQPGANVTLTSPSLFAVWWDPDRDEGKNRVVWAVGAVWSEMFKSLYYVVGGLAFFGLVAARRRIFAPDPGLLVLIAIGLLNVLLLLYLATRIGYVSERHTVLFVMLACVFAAASFESLAHLAGSLPGIRRLVVWPNAAPGGFLVAIVAAALPVTLQTMHPHREGHKHAGRWLANNMNDGDWLKDPLAWGEWYAGRTLYNPPVYRGRPETIWVIVESGKGSPHSRLPQWEDALRLKNKGQLVFRWPENAAPDALAVEVYKVKYDDAFPPPPPKPKRNVAPPPRVVERPGVAP
jgi:4-amino-4-deoxy-L-arabinose transferase-like glycosyltransferase